MATTHEDATSRLAVRDGIVFVGGLGHEGGADVARHIGRLIMMELGRRTGKGSAFRLTSKSLRDGALSAVFTIRERRGSGYDRALFDIYVVEYGDVLTRDLNVRNPLIRSVYMVIAFVSMLVRYPLLLRPRRRSKPLRELAQAYLATICLLLVALYTLTVVVALIDLVWTRIVGHSTEISSTQAIVVVASGLGLFAGTFREKLTGAAINWAAGTIYLMPSPVRARVNGQVRSAIETVVARPEVREVHLLTFSFGTIVGLDVVFPKASLGVSGTRVDHLITVGCPYDFIRLFAPSYFDKRAVGQLCKWTNVFVPSDILGSNFRRDKGIGPAELGISDTMPRNIVYSPEDSLAAFSILRLSAFRAHDCYWGEEGQPSCFAAVVEELSAKGETLRKGNHGLS